MHAHSSHVKDPSLPLQMGVREVSLLSPDILSPKRYEAVTSRIVSESSHDPSLKTIEAGSKGNGPIFGSTRDPKRKATFFEHPMIEGDVCKPRPG